MSGGKSSDAALMSGPSNNGIIEENQVKLNEIFQLEEIIHFQRINNKLGSPSKLVSTQGGSPKRRVEFGDSTIINGQDAAVDAHASSSSFSFNPLVESRECESDSCNKRFVGSSSSDDGDDGCSHSSEESDSQVFNKAENYSSDMLDAEPGTSTSRTAIVANTKVGLLGEDAAEEDEKQEQWRMDHTQMAFRPFNYFVLNVKRADVILDAIVFFTILGEFLTDVTLTIWHYRDGMRWSAGITVLFLLLGSASMLHQFNGLQESDIRRIFNRGKRIRILVNCFTPLTTLLSSLRCLHLGCKALRDPMVSSQYMEVENFSKTLYKTQSVFQSAPLATVQLVILVEALSEGSIGLFKGLVSMTNIALCWSVMTNANLPSKVEDYDHVKKVSQSPSRRLYIGVRMFSSFASRTMGVTSLLISCRCLLGPSSGVRAIFVGTAILFIPRVIFFLVDFIRQRTVTRRDGNESDGGISGNNGGLRGARRASCCETFMGYMATILFPVGHPVWIFWYIWGETALCVIIGNILGWSKGCLPNVVNAVYTGMFLVLFIVIPILVPIAQDTVRQRRIRKAENFFQRSPHYPDESDNAHGDGTTTVKV